MSMLIQRRISLRTFAQAIIAIETSLLREIREEEAQMKNAIAEERQLHIKSEGERNLLYSTNRRIA